MCISIFSKILSEIFLILRRIQRHIIINVHTSSCKVPIIIVRSQQNLNFLNRFSKKYSNIKFYEICPVEAKLFHADGQTQMTKLTVAFRSFVKAPLGYSCFLPPASIKQFRQPHCILTRKRNRAMRKRYLFTSCYTQHHEVSNAALTARESLMKDWPSELVALRVAPMGTNWGPSNDDDDYLSIFHPSPGALLVRLQVMQHFTITAATRHILQMWNKGAAFWLNRVNV